MLNKPWWQAGSVAGGHRKIGAKTAVFKGRIAVVAPAQLIRK
jgi:hypothetical protein